MRIRTVTQPATGKASPDEIIAWWFRSKVRMISPCLVHDSSRSRSESNCFRVESLRRGASQFLARPGGTLENSLGFKPGKGFDRRYQVPKGRQNVSSCDGSAQKLRCSLGGEAVQLTLTRTEILLTTPIGLRTVQCQCSVIVLSDWERGSSRFQC